MTKLKDFLNNMKDVSEAIKNVEYVDLKNISYRWTPSHTYFHDCKTPSKERAEEVYNSLAGNYTVLKESKFK